jgi:nitroimidazol reductase NimA-like FMN-containing flavoprotein (pyridoxamine 5'-phosphate oxidase superfamily)
MPTGLTLKHHRGTPNDVAEILNKPLSQEMLNRDIARLAYVAKDGTPRVVPIAFTWNGTEVVMCTTTNAPKLVSLRRNPAVALTIDIEVHHRRSCCFEAKRCSTKSKAFPTSTSR